jgi:hypothetical protein
MCFKALENVLRLSSPEEKSSSFRNVVVYFKTTGKFLMLISYAMQVALYSKHSMIKLLFKFG